MNGKAVLPLDGSEILKSGHFLHFMALSGVRSIFLKSTCTADTKQDAEMQANQEQNVIGVYGGANEISGITSDNTASCIIMRNLVAEQNQYMIYLNDQANVANILVKDMRSVPFIYEAFKAAIMTSKRKYAPNHQRLLAR